MRTYVMGLVSVVCVLAATSASLSQPEDKEALVTIDYLYPLTAEYGIPSRVLVDYVERAFEAEYRQWGAHQLLADQSLALPPHVADTAWSFVTGGEGPGTWLWIDGELVTKYWWDWDRLPDVITQRTGFSPEEVGVRLLEMGPKDVGDPGTDAGETLIELWGVVGFLVCDGPEQIGVLFVHPKDRFPLTDEQDSPGVRTLSVSGARGAQGEGPPSPDQWKQALELLTQWAREHEWKRVEAEGTADVPAYYRWCQQLPRDWYAAVGFTVAEVRHDVNRQAILNMRDGLHGPEDQDDVQNALAAGMTVDDIATMYHMAWEAE